jgi:hypothetical protein
MQQTGGGCEWHLHMMLARRESRANALDTPWRAEYPRGLTASAGREYLEVVGTLYYGCSATPIHIEDRALAHLKVVIASKLRRHEAFTVSWPHPEHQGPGRTTIWLHPSIPLRFEFDETEPPPLRREWLEELATSAHSTGGIVLMPEIFGTAVERAAADVSAAEAQP